MTIKEAEDLLQGSEDMLDIFENTLKQHPGTPRTVRGIHDGKFDQIKETTQNLFLTGVAFLSQQVSNNHLRDIGTVTWWMLESQRINPVTVEDIVSTGLTAKDSTFASPRLRINEPFFYLNARRPGHHIDDDKHIPSFSVFEEDARLLIPIEFTLRAIRQPIAALSRIAGICSEVMDFANNIHILRQESMTDRSLASEAHFLIEARKQFPNSPLTKSRSEVLSKYPRGIDSLAQNLRYIGGIAQSNPHRAERN